MAHPIAPTARRGQSRSGHDALARGLGYFSLAIGFAQILAPRSFCQALGMEGHENTVRTYGAREIATGVAILTSHDATPWIWGRVAGDALDIGTVSTGLRHDNPKQGNVVAAMGALVGITALDVICAGGLTGEKGGRRTAVADYSDRTGFPRGTAAMRGAARDFEVPRDMRIPDPLRPDLFERRGAVPAPSGAQAF
jgi:hypothetical protein